MRKKKADENGHEPLPLSRGLNLDDAKGREAYPTLFDVLLPRFKDGKCTRAGGTLTVRIIGTVYFCKIVCPTEQVQTTIAGHVLSELFGHLDQTMRNGQAVWLPDYESQQKSRRESRL